AHSPNGRRGRAARRRPRCGTRQTRSSSARAIRASARPRRGMGPAWWVPPVADRAMKVLWFAAVGRYSDGRSQPHEAHMSVTYQLEPDLAPEAFIDVLRRSTLAERRPIHEADTIRGML